MIRDIEHPLMNGAGCIKTLEGVEKMCRSAVSAVVLGSITYLPRQGNSGTTYVKEYQHSVNALGLPNPGADYYHQHLPEMVEICGRNGKPLVVSLAGFQESDWRLLVDLCKATGVETVELNFGCPNAQSEHPIWSFDPFNMREITHLALDAGLDVGIKLSPFSNPEDLRKASIVPKGTEYVATSNTFPNVPADGLSVPYGGMSGRALMPIALGQVSQLRDRLDDDVAVIGVGGIRNSHDIAAYLDAGAFAVQVTTAYYDANENPMIFSDILADR